MKRKFKQIEYFESIDGRTFNNELLCINHELKLKHFYLTITDVSYDEYKLLEIVGIPEIVARLFDKFIKTIFPDRSKYYSIDHSQSLLYNNFHIENLNKQQFDQLKETTYIDDIYYVRLAEHSLNLEIYNKSE